jgi:hypothetical protein
MPLDYMDSRLVAPIKKRLFDEIQNSIEKHANYRDKVKVFHKFPYKERPMMGVVVKNASSATRMRLSADDYAAQMSSLLALAGAEGKDSRVLKFVWEDQNNVTKFQRDEDLSSQITGDPAYPTIGTNRVFTVNHKPIVAGPFNTKFADNFAQVTLKLNGETTFAEYVNGEKGIVVLPLAPPVGSKLHISYNYGNMTPPGRYYIEVLTPDPAHPDQGTQFVIDPIYIVEHEELIARTSGTETSAQTANKNLLARFDVLYTLKNKFATKIYLERGIDYTITSAGAITFLKPLITNTSLFIDYRWVGPELGPFNLPDGDYEYNNLALPGVILAFGSERILGDKNVVIVYPQREPAAKVYSGHWNMNIEIEVISRDTQQLPELADYIINDMWSYKRLALINEGITMESFEPTGESEDIFDENTQDQYYRTTLSMVLLSEWKRFEPFLTWIMDFDVHTYNFPPTTKYYINDEGKIFEKVTAINNEPFEVTYPQIGRVRYY